MEPDMFGFKCAHPGCAKAFTRKVSGCTHYMIAFFVTDTAVARNLFRTIYFVTPLIVCVIPYHIRILLTELFQRFTNFI